MQPQTKIATCCYCNSRTVLKLTARDGHELACGSCGAPLHNMKWLRTPVVEKPAQKPPARVKVKYVKSSMPKRKKKRKFSWKKRLEDAWDVIEDIFD